MTFSLIYAQYPFEGKQYPLSSTAVFMDEYDILDRKSRQNCTRHIGIVFDRFQFPKTYYSYLDYLLGYGKTISKRRNAFFFF